MVTKSFSRFIMYRQSVNKDNQNSNEENIPNLLSKLFKSRVKEKKINFKSKIKYDVVHNSKLGGFGKN